uniref:Rap-GAP domain-containing protein n=1 Tax=Sphaeramia orbicularis TaxID=375764 RepID=A0A673C0Y9_9TELE
MFTRRQHGDVKKSTQKVLDPKKDVLTRLKHLRALHVVENRNRSELKAFFESNCSQIYFIFYENFITLESNLKQKGNKSQREELDSILFIFEKILQLLPEKIYNRWQFHSIGSILKKLLHTGNSFKIRCEGIRLFLLWLQALRDNCAEEQFLIFACLVPGFPAVPSSRGPCTLDTIIYNPFSNPPDAKVVPEEITPLVPAVAGEKVADDQTCYILETLLKFMVIQASSLEWKNKENQDTGFRFLFSLFKKYYLPHLFPSFTKLTNLYKPLLDLPHHRPKPLYVPVTRNNESTFCTRDQYLAPRVAFITWLVTFFLEKKYVSSTAAAQNAKNGTEVIPKLIQVSLIGPICWHCFIVEGVGRTSDGDTNGPQGEPDKSHSNSSTLSDRRPSDSSLCSIEEEHRHVYDMVHGILLSTRDNVNFVNEVFHQAFLLPSCEASATRKVIKVYRKWILQEKPCFMTEPDKRTQEDEVDESCVQTVSTETNSMHAQVNVFLTNSSNVFLLEPCQDVPKLLDNQVEVCKGVLSIYRHMIMEHTMNTQTWEQMLQVLLRITEAVMKRPQDNQRKDSFTIIVAWVRANLCVFISRELWDELLAVLSSLTCWEELVTEWASIMDSLTAVLARSVYGLDMANLPLDKLSEQKEKKQRGRGEWEKWVDSGPGVQEPMRIRSATTSGAPGVETARNNVRQKASGKHIHIQCSNTVVLAWSYIIVPLKLVKYSAEENFSSVSITTAFSLSFISISIDVEVVVTHLPLPLLCTNVFCEVLHCDHHEVSLVLCACGPSFKPNFIPVPLLFLGPECALPPHSAPPSYHHNHYHYPQNPPASPALLVHTECPRDCPLDDTMHHSVLHMPHHLDSSECLADDVSIIAGGTLTGWHADSAFVLWRRILGILGDVNNIRCPKIHAKVFSYLYELWHKLAKIRDNLGISVDNQSSPPQPAFIPPLRMLASWLFRATMLPVEYKAGKLQAYKLICEMMTRHQDVLPNSDFLVHLYYIMHRGFTSNDQDVLNTIIRSCSPRFFFLGLPGFTMLVGDFITAAACVLSSDSPEAPRMEAQTTLGSLVCFPNLYLQIPILQCRLGLDDIVVGNEDIKCHEPGLCIAVCSLGLWVCEELMQKKVHHQVKDAINVLGVTLKFGNKAVAQVACDVLQLLICHWEHLQRLDPTLPKKIIEVRNALQVLHLKLNNRSPSSLSQLMVSLLLCLLDWCMAVPLNLLLETITMPTVEDHTSHKAPLLDYIYRVSSHTDSKHFLEPDLFSLSALNYFLHLKLYSKAISNFSHMCLRSEIWSVLLYLFILLSEKRRRNMELIPLTARMVMTHLVNHLGHHPLSGGPALLHSLVSENHDNPYVESSELSSEVFKSPNLQLFVFNDSTLVSYLQIPADTQTVGQPPHPSSQVRVIVRDISGKYSWDGSILYFSQSKNQPPSPGRGTYKNHCSASNSLSDCGEEEEVDILDKLLEELGHSSPECLPQPQLNLNQPAPSPCGMNLEQEGAILEAILRQTQQEEEQVRRWDADVSFRAACQREPSHQEPKAPFYFCRLLLNDLGMNSWDRRKSFHLLKKNSKLLRELKNLDSRQCRETHKIAVFYIGEGQEDKCSILSNSAGSQAYEDFVSGLGWEVDLATHCGFMGGLQRNGSTGLTAPYYATSTMEAIFHVSTRMPSDSDDSLTKKLRHLGNDEVHIVWSEHTRDYRRGIIPTDFGDVLIIIYPMKNHMYFIQIMKKPQVPFFGPLFNGAIITGTLLPSLVRATCINASRAVKSRLTLYQSFYEERALYLEAIIQNHREVMTFEDFASQVFSPSPGYPISGTGETLSTLLQVAGVISSHIIVLSARFSCRGVKLPLPDHQQYEVYDRGGGVELKQIQIHFKKNSITQILICYELF